MGWGKEWVVAPVENWPNGMSIAIREETIEPTFKNLVEAYARVLNNKKPTHDPYTNPDAHIYYECACGAILDPQTKSFAQLNNCASEKGWKIRFTDKGYVPYCVKCGEGVE